MVELPPSPRFVLLLDRFEEIGGVIEFFRFALEGADGSSGESHRQAALGVLKSLGRQSSRCFHVTIEESALIGRPITLAEFFGPGFDFSNRRLRYREPSCDAINGLFWDLSPSGPSTRSRQTSKESEFVTDGFAEAFAAPPHGLSGTDHDVKRLFREFVHEFFADFAYPATIWRWSTNCSNYFDAGHEWWGSFFWTVHCQIKPYLIGIAASTTD